MILCIYVCIYMVLMYTMITKLHFTDNLGADCDFLKTCKVVGSKCIDGTCSCPPGQVPHNKFSCTQS